MKPGLRGCLFITFIFGASLIFVGCTAAYHVRTVNSPEWKYAAICYIRGGLGCYIHEDEKLIKVSIYALKPDAKESSEREMREAAADGIWRSSPNGSKIKALLFENRYWVKGSAIAWEPDWGPQ
jgi:hypothetical protein